MEMMEFREEWLDADDIPEDLESADDAEEM
jgi:hypothetical protein